MTVGKKLYYAPGMISLIGLFIFFKLSINKFQPQQYSYLPITVPSENKDEPYYRFSSYWMEKLIKKKKQIQLTLDDDEKTNRKKLELIKYEAGKIKYTQDTSTVTRIWFTNDITYGTLVRLIDLCHAEGHKRFVLLKNSFVIFGEYPYPKRDTSHFLPTFICGTAEMQQERQMLRIKKEEARFKSKRYTEKKRLYLFAGWLALVISFLYFRKNILPH